MAFDMIEPIGGPADDVRMGMVAATIANVQRDPKSTPDPYVPFDFIPWARDGSGDDAEPIQLDDDVEQSNLIRAVMFGLPPADQQG